MHPAVEIARSLIGVKWVHQGRNPKIGIDCAGLVVLSYGIKGEVPNYARNPHRGTMERELTKWIGEPLQDGSVQPGDVVALGDGRVARHCGIVGDFIYGGLSLIHTDSVVGQVVEVNLSDWLAARIKLVFRK